MNNKLLTKLKTNSMAIILVLLMASVMLFAMPTPTKAQTTPGAVTQMGSMVTYAPWATTVPSGVTANVSVVNTAFLSVTPYTVGVGQTLLVNVWQEPPTQTNRFYSGYTVTITAPNGATQTVGPFNSYQGDSTAYFDYAPSQVGNYTFQFNFAGNYFPAGWYFNGIVYNTYADILASPTAAAAIAAINPAFLAFSGPAYLQSAYYEAAASPVQTVTVQQQLVAGWPPAPLPTDTYWKFPIPIDYREWWIIGGQYPFDGQGGGTGWPANTNTFASNYAYTPYAPGPTSAHIVWVQQGGLVGIAGGQFGYRSIGSGETDYSGLPSIIFQGRAYQTVTIPYDGVTQPVWECYNIQTGQIYFQLTGITQPPTVVTENLGTPSEPGAGQTGMGTGTFSLMSVGANLVKYDPWSGAVELNIPLPASMLQFSFFGVSAGTVYDDPYVLSIQSLPSGNYLINWTTTGSDPNFADRVMSNVSYPFSSLGDCDFDSMIAVNTGSIVPAGTGSSSGEFIMGASLLTGKLLWNVTTSNIFFSAMTMLADRGEFAARMLGGFWECWNLQTGAVEWQSATPGTPGGESYPWGDFGAYTVASYGGLLYDFSYAGIYAINWTNGQIAWHFTDPSVPFEVPWYPSSSWFSNSPQIADGMLYYANGEHSPTEPLARGWGLYCLNALTGEEVWNMTGGGLAGPISGGYMAFASNDDGSLYVFGIGPSATTVSAPQTAITAGTNVVISGTVLDESSGMISPNTAPVGSTPAYKNDAELANVACVSDASMTTYMGYLYQQQPIDGLYGNVTVTGVPVTISAVGPSGTSIPIATVTSNAQGTFGYTWTAPTTPGQYTITATFAGDDSYGSSTANTYATVVAPTATATPTPTATPPSNLANTTDLITYIAIAVIVLIIAIAIVGILILRKHA